MQSKQQIYEAKVEELLKQVQDAVADAEPIAFDAYSGFKLHFILKPLNQDIENIFFKKLSDSGWHARKSFDDGDFKGYFIQ